jgi:hypothetical protein
MVPDYRHTATSNTVYYFTSSDTWPTTSYGWNWRTFAKGPQYGWYRLFEDWPTLRELVRCIAAPVPPRRPQARACSMDRRRWKRRRFLHSLRSQA